MSNNTFSVKADVYFTSPSGKRSRRSFDGPWKATPQGAVEACKDRLSKLDRPALASAFLAERVDEKVAGSQDNRGVFYNPSKALDVVEALRAAGVQVV